MRPARWEHWEWPRPRQHPARCLKRRPRLSMGYPRCSPVAVFLLRMPWPRSSFAHVGVSVCEASLPAHREHWERPRPRRHPARCLERRLEAAPRPGLRKGWRAYAGVSVYEVSLPALREHWERPRPRRHPARCLKRRLEAAPRPGLRKGWRAYAGVSVCEASLPAHREHWGKPYSLSGPFSTFLSYPTHHDNDSRY